MTAAPDPRPALVWSWTAPAEPIVELSAFRFPLSAFHSAEHARPHVASFASFMAKPGVVSFPLPKP